MKKQKCKRMVQASSIRQKNIFTKDALLMVERMEKEKFFIKMEMNTKASGLMEKYMVKEFSCKEKSIKGTKVFGEKVNIVET
jgi:hypothetical protein